MKTLTWTAILLVLAAFITCCGPKRQEVFVPTWIDHDYKPCDFRIKDGLHSLSQDIAVSINRSDVPRYDAVASTRPWVINTRLQYKDIGSHLIDEGRIGKTNMFAASWSPDGSSVMIQKGYKDPQYAMWEEAHKTMLPDVRYYRTDILMENINTFNTMNLTAVDEVGFHNAGPVFSSGLPGKILFQSFIKKQMRIFIMDNDGTDKKPLIDAAGFAYGGSLSPDGTKYAFHSEYRVYVGDYATRKEIKVETPCKFNFGPVWSPDSKYIAFYCGATNIAPDVYIADRDGKNVTFLGARNGYIGVVPFTTQYDYHGGGTDKLAWTSDSKSVVLGSMISGSVELVRYGIDGSYSQLTKTNPGSRNVYPDVTADGRWLLFNSARDGGPQNLYIMDMNTQREYQVTDLAPGCNSRYGLWRPQSN